MYCINCGVKLAETEKKCPLCNTVVCHPDFVKTPERTLYPKDKMPQTHSGIKALGGVIIILFLAPLILSFYSDIQDNGKLDWFGFVAGALMVCYVSFALPLWFKKRNIIVFITIAFVFLALYLLYINWKTEGNWFLTFALPIVGGLCLLTNGVITAISYLKKGRLYSIGGVFVVFGGFLLLVEYLLKLTFGIAFIGWSIYLFIALALFGGLLIYLAINSTAREAIARKFFF